MKLRQPYLFKTTSDKERNDNECLHRHCGPQRRKLPRKSYLRFFFGGVRVGDSYFTGRHIGGDTHITNDVYGDTHITVTT